MRFVGLCATYHMTSVEVTNFAALCAALSQEDNQLTLSVLDPTTSNILEYCQLQPHPWYKSTWDTLYANELSHLCKGIGSGESPSNKHVASTITFFDQLGYHTRERDSVITFLRR
jgi:hypothetical protein